jgi:hypothetical protein
MNLKDQIAIETVCGRLRYQLNQTRQQYFRISRAEAEALAALNRRQSESKTQ